MARPGNRTGALGAPPFRSDRDFPGVVAHQAHIDDLLQSYAVGWTLDRMPPVDRNVLRLGVFELLWVDDVPDGVAISEAVELANRLSTEDSPRFINGVLGRIASAESRPAS